MKSLCKNGGWLNGYLCCLHWGDQQCRNYILLYHQCTLERNTLSRFAPGDVTCNQWKIATKIAAKRWVLAYLTWLIFFTLCMFRETKPTVNNWVNAVCISWSIGLEKVRRSHQAESSNEVEKPVKNSGLIYIGKLQRSLLLPPCLPSPRSSQHHQTHLVKFCLTVLHAWPHHTIWIFSADSFMLWWVGVGWCGWFLSEVIDQQSAYVSVVYIKLYSRFSAFIKLFLL